MKNVMSRWLAILALSLFLLSGCSSDSSGTGTATVPPDESAIVTENPEKSDSDESLTQDLGLTSDHIGKPEQSEPRVNPKFCVTAKLWCKIEQKCFKAGAAQAAAAFSTKITALRGNVKGGGVSLRSSRLLTFRLQPVSPACGRQRTQPTVRELCSSPAAFRSTSS